MLKILILLLSTVFQASLIFGAELEQFKNTEMYVTYDNKGKPSLLLGETYETQTGKKKEELIGKTFKFLMEDGSVKDAKIEKLDKVCYMFYGEVEVEMCSFIAVQEAVKGSSIAAFYSDLPELKFEWVYKSEWKEVKAIDFTKVKENIAKHGGVGYKTVVGESIENFEKVKEKFSDLAIDPPKNVGDLIMPKSYYSKYGTLDKKWHFFFSGFAWVVLKKGELFYVGLDDYGKHDFQFALNGEVKLNGVNFYLLRYGESITLTSLNNFNFPGHPTDVGSYRPMLAYVRDGLFQPGIRLAFFPCLSKFYMRQCHFKIKSPSGGNGLFQLP